MEAGARRCGEANRPTAGDSRGSHAVAADRQSHRGWAPSLVRAWLVRHLVAVTSPAFLALHGSSHRWYAGRMKRRLVGTAILLVLCHAVPAAAADSAPGCEAFRGTLGKGKKVSFTMLLRREGTAVSGLYYYESTKTDIPLSGTWAADGAVTLTESDRKGKPSATFSGKLVGTRLTGHWTELKGNKGRPPRDLELSAEKGLAKLDVATMAEQSYDGRLGGKHAIRMALSGKAGKLSGYYRYRNSKEDLALSGDVSPSGELRLEEHDKRGKVTGAFSGLFLPGLRVFGSWTNPSRTKTFPVELALSRTQLRPAVELSGGWRLLPKEVPVPDKTCDATGEYYGVLGLANAAVGKKLTGELKKLAESNMDCEGVGGPDALRSFSSYSITTPSRLGKFLIFNQSFYREGGAHPQISDESLIFDTETGETVNLLAYLKPNQANALSRFVNQKLLQEAEDPSIFFAEGEVTSGRIYPNGKGAEIGFSPEDITPYVMGPVSTSLDPSQLRKYFQANADTKALFGL
jgi:hypothetical protein